MNKYDFGYARAKVECPELDALLADLSDVFTRHGVVIVRHRDYDYPDTFELHKLGGNRTDDLSFITDNIEDADNEIPWIATAKTEAKRQWDEITKAEIASKDAARAIEHERNLLERDVIIIDGRRYKLVPND